MDAVTVPVQPVSTIMAVPRDASVETLCSLLIQYEKAQHRYQWASGLVLVHLMGKADAPKAPHEFVEWLTDKTGMLLTQNEIRRRVTVYNFYSRFADAKIIDLIENGGVRMAYQARKAIDQQAPEQARAVLQACIDNPTEIDETLSRLAQRRHRTNKSEPALKAKTYVTIRRSALDNMRDRLIASVEEFKKRDWVPLKTVLELLDSLDDPTPMRGSHEMAALNQSG